MKIMNIGKCGMMYHIPACARTISERLREPAVTSTDRMMTPIAIS
jgi:hypothetical protein